MKTSVAAPPRYEPQIAASAEAPPMGDLWLHVGTVEARLDALSRDPWEEYFRARQRIAKGMAAALGRL